MSTAIKAEIEMNFGSKITGKLPPAADELHAVVDRVQCHTYSVACHKGNMPNVCRFSFPRPPSDRTILAEPPEDVGQLTQLQE